MINSASVPAMGMARSSPMPAARIAPEARRPPASAQFFVLARDGSVSSVPPAWADEAPVHGCPSTKSAGRGHEAFVDSAAKCRVHSYGDLPTTLSRSGAAISLAPQRPLPPRVECSTHAYLSGAKSTLRVQSGSAFPLGPQRPPPRRVECPTHAYLGSASTLRSHSGSAFPLGPQRAADKQALCRVHSYSRLTSTLRASGPSFGSAPRPWDRNRRPAPTAPPRLRTPTATIATTTAAAAAAPASDRGLARPPSAPALLKHASPKDASLPAYRSAPKIRPSTTRPSPAPEPPKQYITWPALRQVPPRATPAEPLRRPPPTVLECPAMFEGDDELYGPDDELLDGLDIQAGLLAGLVPPDICSKHAQKQHGKGKLRAIDAELNEIDAELRELAGKQKHGKGNGEEGEEARDGDASPTSVTSSPLPRARGRALAVAAAITASPAA